MKNFTNKVAAITGGGSGIGRAVALELAKHGCHIALADINQEGMIESRKLIEAYGVTTSTHLVNVAEAASVERFANEVIAKHGNVNIVFNNAGITLQKSFEGHSLQDWERIIGINLWGVIYGCHFFLPHLRASGDAHIINTSSMAGYMGLPTQAGYSATKGAIKNISETLWTELSGEGIGVTSVHPGAIRTNIMYATLKESENMEAAKRNLDLANKIGMDVEKAAKIIVSAVKKNKLRVRVGMDAIVLDLLKRLLPTVIHRPLASAFKKQMS